MLFLALAFRCWRELDFRNPRRFLDVRTKFWKMPERTWRLVKNAVWPRFPLSVGTQRRDIERLEHLFFYSLVSIPETFVESCILLSGFVISLLLFWIVFERSWHHSLQENPCRWFPGLLYIMILTAPQHPCSVQAPCAVGTIALSNSNSPLVSPFKQAKTCCSSCGAIFYFWIDFLHPLIAFPSPLRVGILCVCPCLVVFLSSSAACCADL